MTHEPDAAPHTSPLIDAARLRAWLANHTPPDLVDATWFLPGSGETDADAFAARHIPGAVFLDIDTVADQASPLPHMLPSPDMAARAFAALGLHPGRPVVVYDQSPMRSAARVWWMLRAFGFTDVAVLDGGLNAWQASGGPIADGAASDGAEPEPLPATLPATLADPRGVADLGAVRDALDDPDAVVLDARPAERFTGAVPEPRPGLRPGHMPGAVNLPLGCLYHPDGTMLEKAQLIDLFTSHGVAEADRIVTSCGSGVTAASLVLALAVVGRTAELYDASWAEWGGRQDCPVATGG
ncbi:sulfurtransferase [Yunchengibacter salinarum]|uniref:sulfurtransferase n=1 Tax=Yunchengibacter salinarum TaxID=3133399 RepID=UPI0035B5EF05